jgi:hypothetical protein
VRFLNRGTVEGVDRHRVVELELGGGKRVRHNRVRIETEGEDFLRRVEILGSADRREWLKLAEGWLIDHSEPSRVRNTEIGYPDSDLPFLRLLIRPNARNASETPVVSAVEIGRFARERGDWESFALRTAPPPAGEKPAPRAQAHYFDTGARNRPVERLILRIEDGEFARPVQVWGRNDPGEEWRLAHRGEVHRLGDKTRLDVPLSGFAYRHVKVEIFHYDDEPVRVTGASGEALARYLVAESRADVPAYLYYGSPVADPPQFDLMTRKGDAHAAKAAKVGLLDREPNEAFGESRLARMLPWITGGSIAAVSLILVWVISGMLRRRPAAE